MASGSSDSIGTVFNIVFFIIFFILIFRKGGKRTPDGQKGPRSVIDLFSQAFRQRGSPGAETAPPPPQASPQKGPDTSGSQNTTPAQLLTALLAPSLNISSGIARLGPKPKRLERRKKYLQVALNSTLIEAQAIIRQLPSSERIIVEAGTPLIKIFGAEAIRAIRRAVASSTYVVADLKVADLADREVDMACRAGAQAATCLGVAPIETIERFIASCRERNLDSMVDMMNVSSPLQVLKRLKKLPNVVMLHRGVDESEFSKEKQIPWYQIQQIKGASNVLVSVAGGDTIREVQRSIFNSADIVVVWKDFYHSTSSTGDLAGAFLREIK
ncbi:MAG: orotidine 5'-phosphate decarboxylase / HUMPS family protein [Patescibacteria group bacterium]